MRRYVEMTPNCLEWLKLQKFDLPIVNANHKWNKFLQSAKVELAYNMAGLTIVSDTAFVRMVCEAPTMRERSRYKLATQNEFSFSIT